MPFEYFVRPFQSPDTQGRAHIPSTPSGFDQRATLTWGAKSAVNAMDTKGISVTTHWPDATDGCCIEKFDENGRTTSQVKIVDSHDSENWIIVNRATSLDMSKEHRNNCQEFSVWYNKQFNASSASVLANYDREAAQMGVRTAEPERCKTTMNLNANTA